ncbi:sulfurtransferase complex subunit TusB [Candidatus Woesearchaeota archaeon]|nr:sulfurtransferase complex subunit TusB [Candidatus Woesearchaeota archaeon]
MSVLHLVTRSPWHSPALDDCLSRLGDGDDILLLADGVYSVTCATALEKLRGKLSRCRCRCHLLGDDLVCRGLAETALPESFRCVDHPAFVQLTGQHRHCVSW